ncbi:hypothetical protein PG997_001585 [Apiospora hydei]|uniref:AB hydrolase-1 domain-containing protein n=1 Tax=Apiospora hydei TaxID=1337664 RepID=A0ABR1XDY1_9PEZI
MAAAPRPSFLFVPGAWHRTWIYDPLRADLAARGFPSAAVELASVGAQDPASTGLEADITAIRAGLEGLIDAEAEVVVVAHSYGGIPAAGAVQGLSCAERARQGEKGGVLMLVHMAAFAVPAGTSLRDNLPGREYPPWWNVQCGRTLNIRFPSQGDIVTPIDPPHIFYCDVEPSLTAKAEAAILPHTLKAMEDKSGFAPWEDAELFEMGYIFAEEDQAIPLVAQKAFQSQFPADSFTASLRASHSPFLSMPGALGGVLDQAAEFALKKRGT